MKKYFENIRIKNDYCGNPRRVVHFFELLTSEEIAEYSIGYSYKLACKRANTVGGRKYTEELMLFCMKAFTSVIFDT